jgi:hypothetical protein
VILFNMGSKNSSVSLDYKNATSTLVKKCPIESYFEKYGFPLCIDDKFPCTLVFEITFLGEFCQ